VVEQIEYFDNAVDTRTTVQREMLLQSHVDTVNGLADNAVARRDSSAGARRTRPRAANRAAGVERVAAVGRREPLSRSVEIQPDSTENHTPPARCR
jgi:hypothetical protein